MEKRQEENLGAYFHPILSLPSCPPHCPLPWTAVNPCHTHNDTILSQPSILLGLSHMFPFFIVVSSSDLCFLLTCIISPGFILKKDPAVHVIHHLNRRWK